MVDFHSILVTSYKLLNCFSLIKNTSFILSTNVGNGDLTYLHGIRVLSLFWIILLHHTVTIITMPGSPNPGEKCVHMLCHLNCLMERLFLYNYTDYIVVFIWLIAIQPIHNLSLNDLRLCKWNNVCNCCIRLQIFSN